MPRIPELTEREAIPEDQRQHYDAIMASRKRIGAPYANLLHCPDLAARTAHLVGYSLHTSDFPKKEKELVICTVAREMDCVYEWAAHSGHALDAGVREEAVAAIRDGRAPEGLNEDEAPFVGTCRSFCGLRTASPRRPFRRYESVSAIIGWRS